MQRQVSTKLEFQYGVMSQLHILVAVSYHTHCSPEFTGLTSKYFFLFIEHIKHTLVRKAECTRNIDIKRISLIESIDHIT